MSANRVLPENRAPSGTAQNRPLTVLIADDSLITHTIGTAILRKVGHMAECVENGRDAVARAWEGRFDLILMDLQMPEMDGIAATKAIRALPPPRSALPIIALTVNSAHEQLAECLSAGMNGYIVKPFTSDSMLLELTRVMSLIDGPSSTEDRSRHRLALAQKQCDGSDWLDIGLFDEGQLASLHDCLGDEGYRDLLASVSASLAPSVNAVKLALSRGDFAEVRMLAQRLRGDASVVGAKRVARFADFLGKTVDAETVSELVNDMESIYQDTVADIRGKSWS